MNDDFPHGFVLSDAALYSFKCQDVFPDIVSFAAAIPEHLRPLFLIPIQLQTAGYTSSVKGLASRIASEYSPTGQTPESDLFGTQTFVNYDNEPGVPSSDPGSIWEINDPWSQTHHQDLVQNQDENIQVPSETSYMTDVDISESGLSYPYYTPESPIRHSSVFILPRNIHLALKPEQLQTKTPKKIKDNASSCSVSMDSYDKRGRVFTFTVDCGNTLRTVRASLSDINHIACTCDCPFWRYNGPDYNSKTNDYLLGQPTGKATPPNVRDPNREYAICKHVYAVIVRLDSFVVQIIDENWEMTDEELLEQIDKDWDRMERVSSISMDEAEDPDVEVEYVGNSVKIKRPSAESESEDDEDVEDDDLDIEIDVDLDDLEDDDLEDDDFDIEIDVDLDDLEEEPEPR